jgi:hypothetical protein
VVGTIPADVAGSAELAQAEGTKAGAVVLAGTFLDVDEVLNRLGLLGFLRVTHR